jgi:uncharacterized protein (TIGR02147 family)
MDKIFTYSDYRKFLKDAYTSRKSIDIKFSYRFIAKEAGFNSSSYFLKIIGGSRDISLDLALRLADVFKLKKQEKEYFGLLVQFNQAKTHSEKSHYYEKLGAFRKSKSKLISPDEFEIFDKWYYVAIREMLAFHHFKGDFQSLARKLIPSITPGEAVKAIHLLERLGFIRKDSQGRYRKADLVISTGSEWQAMSVAGFQLQSLELARKAFDNMPRSARDISTLTLSISAEVLAEVKERIKKCREEILELSRDERGADGVYQLNMQFFPLSRIEPGIKP